MAARIGRTVFAAAALSALAAFQLACSGGDGSDGEPVTCETDLAPELARLGVPGLSAAIVKNGRVVCTAVAGLANIEENRPVTPDTAFWWASVSKPVAATAAMSIFEEGGFALEDAVNDKIPFQVSHPDAACADKPITFFQLLTHTSSIQEDERVAPYKDAFVVGEPRPALGDWLQDYLLPDGAFYSPTANFTAACPGDGYQYSSIAYGLLGFAVETIVDESFDQVCMHRVFEPLGMTNTSFTLADLDVSKVAMGYKGTQGSFAPVGYQEHPNYPDGSLRSSVLELARFLIMSMQLGEYEGTRILAETTVQEMFKVQVTSDDDDEQGFAWYRDDFDNWTDLIGHGGGDPGARSLMFFHPADGAGVLLVANGEWDEDLSEEVFVKLFDESTRY